MKTQEILRKGLSALFKGAVIEILADVPGAGKAVDLLKENFTFTAAEIAKNFQDSYGYALAAIGSGLAEPENQRGFWQSLLQANVESEFSQSLEQDYLLPFASDLDDEKLAKFRQVAIKQCQQMAGLTLFQADNVRFSEAELASFVTVDGASSLTDVIVELVQTQQALDEQVLDFLQFKELLGNAVLFFLYEQLRKEPRFQTTLAALKHDGLMVDVHEIKNIVQSTEDKLNQAFAAKKFAEIGQLGQQLEHWQQVESVMQTHYGQFVEFSQQFADWTQLVKVQLSQVLAAMPKLQEQLGEIKDNTEQILAIVLQLQAQSDLSSQVKPRDESIQYSSASLELIKEAHHLMQHLSPSVPQYSQAAIGLGSVVSSLGDLQQAEALFIKAYQQARNDEERALSAFNLFQVFIRQQIYDKALSSLQEAIELNPQRYALFNEHTYEIQQILGAGGMGCVFLARNRFKRELVVIKCFWETMRGSADVLFKEAKLMAKIAGDFVPQPFDCGFVDLARQERGYFISEYIEGAIDGESWLAKFGKLDVATGIAVGLQIAKGLQLAHAEGIFHLDLKPANILLQRQKTYEVSKTSQVSVKIIDFGLARVAVSLGAEMAAKRSRSGLSLLAQGAVFGTLDYAPPEQQGVDGEPSAKSDVYAFGKTLYRLLTGESPQTFRPRCLTDSPELFELLCDCVEIEPDKRVGLGGLLKGLEKLLSPVSELVELSPKPVERIIQKEKPRIVKVAKKQSPKPIARNIQQEKSRIVQIDNRKWWKQLDRKWKIFFRQVVNIDDVGFFNRISGKLYDNDLEKIVNLQELNCSWNQISDLEPLCVLTNLQKLDCHVNKISDLEPLRALTNLQTLWCYENKIIDLEPLYNLTNLQELYCGDNKISDLIPLRALIDLQKLSCSKNQISNLEPLCALNNLHLLECGDNQISDLEPLYNLTNLQELYCGGNKISDSEIERFKKFVPNCKVRP
ncbi:leucine-rich repeat domain-containing protein [Candidatus Halobeggiatoa sp. HSG11]|nr:leucine-rich repeat domain-containing protein [Candidatus Halobeggiatoa sp. HSG11]